MEGYRNLGYTVLKNAVMDYYEKIRNGINLEVAEKQLDIDDVWFFVTDVNKEWFLEKVHKRGKEIWQRKYGKKII